MRTHAKFVELAILTVTIRVTIRHGFNAKACNSFIVRSLSNVVCRRQVFPSVVPVRVVSGGVAISVIGMLTRTYLRPP